VDLLIVELVKVIMSIVMFEVDIITDVRPRAVHKSIRSYFHTVEIQT